MNINSRYLRELADILNHEGWESDYVYLNMAADDYDDLQASAIKPGQVILVYMDEGAKGVCAQCMSITAPGTSIHVFQDFNALRDYVSERRSDVKKYRKEPVWRHFIVGEDDSDSIQFHN